MKKIVILIYVVSLVFLSSCGSKKATYANDLMYLKQGMKYSKLDSLYNIKDQPNFDIEFDNQKYSIAITGIENYHHEDSRLSSRNGSTGASYINSSYTATDAFYFIFKDRKLENWAYMYEFKNDYSNKINQFAQAISEGLANYYKIKK